MTPDWHDYPTGPGVWVMTWVPIRYELARQYSIIPVVSSIRGNGAANYVHNGQHIPVPRTDDPEHIIYRYYGPLPNDPQDQGETN